MSHRPGLRRFGACVAFAAALTACSQSPPTRYHALLQPPGPMPGGSAKMLVEILPIAIPERLNREEMVMTGADGVIGVRDQDHWAAPLPDEIRQIVADALWRRSGAADDYRAPVPQSAGSLARYRLALRIDRFEAGPGRAARVDAEWIARRLPDGPAAVCRASFGQGGGADTPDAAVRSLSEATERLADAVAVSLARLDAGVAGGCP